MLSSSIESKESLSIILFSDINQGAYRIINYNTEFPPPTPFKIININKDNSALSGDTINLTFNVMWELPDSIKLYLKESNSLQIKTIGKINDTFNYTINNIKSDVTYWTKYDSYSIFSAWDSIGTNPENIIVKQRPIILENNFTKLIALYK